MNICMLTTWNSKCGIAEYSKNLVKEYLKQGHNVLVLGNNAWHDIPVNNFWVEKVFGVSWWGEDPRFDYTQAWEAMNEFEKHCGPIDVLHVQYQSSLYEPEGFNRFVAGTKCKRVITLHDSSINSNHRFEMFDGTITHNVLPFSIGKTVVFDMPTLDIPVRVFSFGMGGRNDYKLLQKMCDEHKWKFNYHDAREHGWITEQTLVDKIQDADVVALWYNEVPIVGQSSAIRMAISAHRPVVVNDVGWFKTAPPFITRVSSIEEMVSEIDYITHEGWMKLRNYSYLADNIVKEFYK